MSSEHHLHVIDHVQDSMLVLVNQDPVRSHIPAHVRVGPSHRVLVLLKDQEPQCVLCVALCDQVCESEQDLFDCASEAPKVVMLYTIWSLQPGAGARMVHACINYVKQHWPTVCRVVTLSPPTQMAQMFHEKNGARLLKHNGSTVNFEYDLH